MSTPTSPLVAKAETYFYTLAAIDTDRLDTLLAPDYTHTFLPASAGLDPTMDRDTFIGRIGSLRNVLTHLRVAIIETWSNDAGRTITAHATNSPQFADSLKRPEDAEGEWDFEGEYMWILTFDESCDKIIRSVEFVDGAATEKLKAQMGKAFGRVAGAGQ